MRMEKINEHQIRCVVNNADLAMHKITTNELRYGSNEANELFRTMLDEASAQYNFNEEELPVMIEAIPMNSEELLIIISAVEDADELDPHFVKFSKDAFTEKKPKEKELLDELFDAGKEEDIPYDDGYTSDNDGNDSSLDDSKNDNAHANHANNNRRSAPRVPITNVGVFHFNNMDEVIYFCRCLHRFSGKTMLYRGNKKHEFFLSVLRPYEMSPLSFRILLSQLCEYAPILSQGEILYAHFSENEKPLIENPHHTLA